MDLHALYTGLRTHALVGLTRAVAHLNNAQVHPGGRPPLPPAGLVAAASRYCLESYRHFGDATLRTGPDAHGFSVLRVVSTVDGVTDVADVYYEHHSPESGLGRAAVVVFVGTRTREQWVGQTAAWAQDAAAAAAALYHTHVVADRLGPSPIPSPSPPESAWDAHFRAAATALTESVLAALIAVSFLPVDSTTPAPESLLVFAGHSRGGALAVFAAARAVDSARVHHVITFGGAPVSAACGAGCGAVGGRTTRFTNAGDPVPRIPIGVHVGIEVVVPPFGVGGGTAGKHSMAGYDAAVGVMLQGRR